MTPGRPLMSRCARLSALRNEQCTLRREASEGHYPISSQWRLYPLQDLTRQDGIVPTASARALKLIWRNSGCNPGRLPVRCNDSIALRARSKADGRSSTITVSTPICWAKMAKSKLVPYFCGRPAMTTQDDDRRSTRAKSARRARVLSLRTHRPFQSPHLRQERTDKGFLIDGAHFTLALVHRRDDRLPPCSWPPWRPRVRREANSYNLAFASGQAHACARTLARTRRPQLRTRDGAEVVTVIADISPDRLGSGRSSPKRSHRERCGRWPNPRSNRLPDVALRGFGPKSS